MTRHDWWQQATATLTAAGCEDAAFDARCLLEDVGGLPRGRMPDDTALTDDAYERLQQALTRRADGYPLQYILGEWDFLTLTLRVGEGVLIPRADTEVLCETAADRLRAVDAPRVLDLCAGSGCVGLGIASLCAGAQVTAVELSDAAMTYLNENIARYPALSVTAVQADVLTDAERFATDYDAIVSNPPYIPTADMDTLMREVHHEPRMALDGSADGLRFYRVIADVWSRRLRDGGFCAVEVGVGQADAVAALFAAAGLIDVHTVDDLGGVARVVCGFRRK